MNSINVDFKPHLRKIELLTQQPVESEFIGEFRSLQRRKGIEFEDYRLFAPGDDSAVIDWKASKRTGHLLLREYTQIRTLSVFIVLDVSNSMLFSSVSKLKCEYAAELAAALSYYFIKSDDMVSLTLFNDKIVKFLPVNFGTRHFNAITQVLTNPALYGGGFNLTNCLGKVQGLIREGSVVVIISDFIGLEKNWQQSLEILSKKGDIIAMVVRDPLDMKITEKIGQAVISDPFSDNVILVDTAAVKQEYERMAEQQLLAIEAVVKRSKGDMLFLDTSRPFDDDVIKFFAKRKARWK